MPPQNYQTKVNRLSAYCAVQYKLLELYNPEIDMVSMLREISPIIIKAIRRRSKKNLKSLEEMSRRTDERILFLHKQNFAIE